MLIQIQFCQFLWVLGGEKKRWENTHFYIFWRTNCDLSTSNPISKKWNILISTHPFVKLKIVLENLGSEKDMVKNPFLDSNCFTSKNPCDSSPPSRRNHEPRTPEKFSKHGFSFFYPIFHFLSKPKPNEKLVSYSMKTYTWTRKTTFI
jgi:hypothetical protein